MAEGLKRRVRAGTWAVAAASTATVAVAVYMAVLMPLGNLPAFLELRLLLVFVVVATPIATAALAPKNLQQNPDFWPGWMTAVCSVLGACAVALIPSVSADLRALSLVNDASLPGVFILTFGGMAVAAAACGWVFQRRLG